MDLERMQQMCHRLQWEADELDWTVTPRAFSRENEMAIVQYFTDMAGIELLAGELFRVQRDRTEEPVLRDVFDTFVVDELRHSDVAERLARHYDVHHYKTYEQNPHLTRFTQHFVEALHHMSPEIGNVYITTGELLLDVALLRSLNDFVDDDMSHQAMRLINRDESRHIAVDYHMVEYYSSPEWSELVAEQPQKPTLQLLRGWLALIALFYHAGPFFREVFFEPMDLTDPTGRRLIEAFKRAQLLGAKPRVAARPFARYMAVLQELFNHPVTGALFGPLIARLMGLDPRVIKRLYTEEEESRYAEMSFDELAQDALGAKSAA